jgi:hypothetical protein
MASRLAAAAGGSLFGLMAARSAVTAQPPGCCFPQFGIAPASTQLKPMPHMLVENTLAYSKEGALMKCELLKVQQVIGETIMQSTISEILNVPENKPGVEQIVSVDGFVRIRRIEVIADKIIVHGRLHVGVVYVGLLDSKPVHYTNSPSLRMFPVACPEWWHELTPGFWISRGNAIRRIIMLLRTCTKLSL